MREERVDQGVLRIARAGMHHHSGRLVDHEQIIVFEQDRERDRFRLRLDLGRRWNFDLNDIIRAHRLTGARLPAI